MEVFQEFGNDVVVSITGDLEAVDGVELTFYNEAGEKVSSITTGETGEYLITLKGGVVYTVKMSKSGYKDSEEKVNLPLNKKGDVFKLEKQFLLNK